MRSTYASLLLALALCPAAPAPAPAAPVAQIRPDAVVTTEAEKSELQQLLDGTTPLLLQGKPVDLDGLQRFYRARNMELAWAGHEERVAALGEAITAATADGLDFQLPAAGSAGKSASRVERDLLLTDTALHLAQALATGRTRPEQYEEDWSISAPAFDAPGGLERALAGGHLAPWLASLAPQHERYQQLKVALAHYREMAKSGNWPRVASGPTIKPGMNDNRIPAIRQRLAAEGYAVATGPVAPPAPGDEAPAVTPDTPPPPTTTPPTTTPMTSTTPAAAIADASADTSTSGSDAPGAGPISAAVAVAAPPAELVYDPVLVEAVKLYQARNGIVVDGEVGARTIAAMNVSVKARAEQIALNLERWRGMPRDFGKSYILVNVPGEALEVVQDGTSVMSMKVVVGDPGHPTPVVQSRVAAVTINPPWRVPVSIGRKEIAPKLKADPAFLEKNDMVMKGAYVFEQLPGPKNPLGRLKVEMPNKYDVYLHDTPTRKAFDRAARALSHGCVRMEDARQMAVYLLNSPKWTDDEIAKAIEAGETLRVDASRRLRVVILYFTSFVDADGTVEFRDDLYGRDKRLRAALQGEIATSAVKSAQAGR